MNAEALGGDQMRKTPSSLRILAALGYFIWPIAIVALVLSKDRKLVRFHGVQALLLYGILSVVMLNVPAILMLSLVSEFAAVVVGYSLLVVIVVIVATWLPAIVYGVFTVGRGKASALPLLDPLVEVELGAVERARIPLLDAAVLSSAIEEAIL